MMKRAGKRHLLAKKSSRHKRGFSLPVEVHKTRQSAIRKLIPSR